MSFKVRFWMMKDGAPFEEIHDFDDDALDSEVQRDFVSWLVDHADAGWKQEGKRLREHG